MGSRRRSNKLEITAMASHHANWVRELGHVEPTRRGRRAESARGREKRVVCPGPSTTAHTGRKTHYFSVLFLLKIFFCWFCFVVVVFFFLKKSLKVGYWLHLQNVKCCCYQSLYRTVQSGQILTNKVSFVFSSVSLLLDGSPDSLHRSQGILVGRLGDQGKRLGLEYWEGLVGMKRGWEGRGRSQQSRGNGPEGEGPGEEWGLAANLARGGGCSLS